MKSILKCDVLDKLTISLDLAPVNEGLQSKDQSSNFRITIYPKDNESRELASKLVPWPAGEEHPTELTFDEREQCVKLRSSTTIADIPLRISELMCQSFGAGTAVLKYKSFSATPLPASDVSSVQNATRELIDSKGSDKKWKAWRKAMASYDGLLTGLISPIDQTDLISVLKDYASDSVDICKLLASRKLFGYKFQQQFLSFCVDRKYYDIVLNALEEDCLCSEEILCQLLKYASSLCEKDGLAILESVLTKGFSDTSIQSSAHSNLTASEVAQIVVWCCLLYNDPKHVSISSQALSLMSALIDSHGSVLVWDNTTHEKLQTAIETIYDLAHLTDYFASYQAHEAQTAISDSEVVPVFRLSKLKLSSRKIVW